MTFIKRMLGLCGLTSALALASGCSDYTYFNVTVYLNQQDDDMIDGSIQGKMTSCKVAVFAGDTPIEHSTELTKENNVNAICKPNLPGVDTTDLAVVNNTKVWKLGVLDYSSARSSGEIKFTVTVRESANEVIAQGSASAGVSSGKILEVPLIINACATSDHPKGEKDCQDIK